MRGFLAYGLRIRSQLDIPGALADGAADAEVEITRASPSAAQSDRLYRFEGDELCFTAPGVAEYRCRPDQLRVTPHPAASEAEVTALLIATALPALLWMRSGFVLHAAAAHLPGWERAIAIAGPSGSGKSTILAQLVAAGASILGDDTIAIDAAARPGEACGLPGGYFLGGGERPRDFHAVPSDRGLVRDRLGAILILSRGGDPAPSFGRFTPVEAVAQLLAHRHRPRVPALLGRHGATLADSALLAATIPLYSWPRSAGPELAAWEWAGLARCAGQGVRDDGYGVAAQ
ncbi:ATP-binding protein [Sphingomonas sp.]|uniref:ATP-binding protein n=1 Tax=Sphingomonas sp. TaxID=28214 RepID=UPI0031D054FA